MNSVTVSLCFIVVATAVTAENPKCLSEKDADFPRNCGTGNPHGFCCEDPNMGAVRTFDFNEKTFGISETCECKPISEICKTDQLLCTVLKYEHRQNEKFFEDNQKPSSDTPDSGAPRLDLGLDRTRQKYIESNPLLLNDRMRESLQLPKFDVNSPEHKMTLQHLKNIQPSLSNEHHDAYSGTFTLHRHDGNIDDDLTSFEERLAAYQAKYGKETLGLN